MNNPYNILAIDHGNHSIKTPNTMFLTGLRSYGTAPQLAEQYLTYGKRYWVRTGDVPAYTPDKTPIPSSRCTKKQQAAILTLANRSTLQ